MFSLLDNGTFPASHVSNRNRVWTGGVTTDASWWYKSMSQYSFRNCWEKHKRRGVIFNKMLFYLISPITCSVSSLRDSLKLENTANNLKLFLQSFYLPTLLSGIGNRCEEMFILFWFLSLTKFSVFTYNHFLEIQIERTQFPGGKFNSYFKRPRKPVSFGEFIW